jgi:3-oxoacyl-[acyl-carrier protein] reductase
MSNGKELAGKVALVTGAGRNIGRAIALALADAGAAVAVNTRASKDDAEKVANEIRGAGGKAQVFMADIVDPKAVNAMVESAVKAFGRLDFLILNASVRKETPFMDMSFEEWKSLISITLDGSFHCVKASVPHMIKKRRVHGSTGKFGLHGMTRALAKELGEHKIRVNCVAPGQMNTARAPGRAVPDVTNVPLARKVEPEEIASTVRFLCGPGAAMISGQLIYVDGGQQQF